MARGHQVLVLPMLGTALGWRTRVAGAITAAPLARILAECCERLLALLQRYISDMARGPRCVYMLSTLRQRDVHDMHTIMSLLPELAWLPAHDWSAVIAGACPRAELRAPPAPQVAAIARYDGRTAMGLSEAVKAQHRLPFFANFVHLAARIEDLLGTLEPSAPGPAPSRTATQQHHLALSMQFSPPTWQTTCW